MSNPFAYIYQPAISTEEQEKQQGTSATAFLTGDQEKQQIVFEVAPWLARFSNRIVIPSPRILQPSQSRFPYPSQSRFLHPSEPSLLHPSEPSRRQLSESKPRSIASSEFKPGPASSELESGSASCEFEPRSASSEFESCSGSVSSRLKYLEAAEGIIASCRQRGGKTVFSRIIEGKNLNLSPLETLAHLSALFPTSLGFLFYTPETGCWIGATPETLLNFDYTTRRVETMAYAGTRPFAGNAPWDTKNLRENQFVADHIVDKFRAFGVEPDVSEPYSSSYGNIQHLRRDISAILPESVDFTELLDALNPTPALCGTPTEAAIADINRYESAPRGCYGGFVALHLPGKFFRSWVCLRCAQLYPDGSFEIHSGGGITSDSIPLSEFRETQAKAAPLLHLLNN